MSREFKSVDMLFYLFYYKYIFSGECMKFILSSLYFLLLAVLNFYLKWLGINILSLIHLSELELKDEIYVFVNVIIYFSIFYFILCFILKFIKKTKVQYYFNKIKCNGIKYILWVSIITILLMTDYKFLFYPFFYYYLCKNVFYKVALIRKFYLDFDSVKKYTFIFLILESPFLLFILLVEILDKSQDPNSWWLVYYFTSNVIFYFPIFIASWWDNRKIIKCK